MGGCTLSACKETFPSDPWDWYIYLHEWLIFMVNVGRCTIHGSYGFQKRCPLAFVESLVPHSSEILRSLGGRQVAKSVAAFFWVKVSYTPPPPPKKKKLTADPGSPKTMGNHGGFPQRLLGCPAGSDRNCISNDRDRKLVYFTYLGDVSNLLMKGHVWSCYNPFTSSTSRTSQYCFFGIRF